MILTPLNHDIFLDYNLILFFTFYSTYLIVGAKVWHSPETELLFKIDQKVNKILTKWNL